MLQRSSSSNEPGSDTILAKEMFIEHNPSTISEDYVISPNCLGQGGFGVVYEGVKKNRYIESMKKIDDAFLDVNSNVSQSTKMTERHSNSDGSNSGDFKGSGDMRAIKKISFQKIKDKQMMENEIQILSYLDHPSILKLYQTYKEKESLYLVTDLLKGGDLFTVIDKDTKANEQQVKVIFEQLVKAVSYLHGQNICHRDLKLENVLFLNENTYSLKLIDFGLAFCWEEDMKAELKESGQNKILAGTPDYMSPQILMKNYDERCDIWAIGVILYILLSGLPPFSGETDEETMQNIRKLNYSLQIEQLVNVSDEAKDLIANILKPEDQRLTISDILSHPWIKCVSKEWSCCEQASETGRSRKNSIIESKSTNKKFKKAQSLGRLARNHESLNIELNDEADFDGPGTQNDPEDLTVEKLEFFQRLSLVEKLVSIYSVSKLSESKTFRFGMEFMEIDRNSDGVICLEDLHAYLLETFGFKDEERIQGFFNALDLSQRGCINYCEYLACVLAFDSCHSKSSSEEIGPVSRIKVNSESLMDQLQGQSDSDPEDESELKELSKMQNFGSTAERQDQERIDIYEDCNLYELFRLLDKDGNEEITPKDFINFFSENGIEEHNALIADQFIEKVELVQQQSTEQDTQSFSEGSQKEQFQRKRTKQRLSNTYKGSKDGGKCKYDDVKIDFELFVKVIRIGALKKQNLKITVL